MGESESVIGIVIGAIPYSDSSKIVKIITREWGVVPVFVRMGKGKRAGNSKSLWHPFAAVELTDLKRKNAESLATFKEAERCLPANTTLKDPKRTAVAFFLSEVLEKSIHEGAPLAEVFDVVYNAIILLENSESVANLHFYVLAKVVGALGLMPRRVEELGRFARRVELISTSEMLDELRNRWRSCYVRWGYNYKDLSISKKMITTSIL